MEFHVLSYNIHKGLSLGNRRFTLPHLRAALEEWAPDIVCLQEVQGLQRPRRQLPTDWSWSSQVNYLGAGLFPFAAYGANAHRRTSHHGNAILSRYPIVTQRNVDLSVRTWERRGLLHAVVDLRDEPVHVISTHLNLRANDRQRQLELIAGYLADAIPEREPIVLAGDFNDWRRQAHGRLANLDEAFLSLHGEHARTYPSFLPLLALDRVYARHLEVVNAVHHSAFGPTRPSDHGALSVKLRLHQSAPGRASQRAASSA